MSRGGDRTGEIRGGPGKGADVERSSSKAPSSDRAYRRLRDHIVQGRLAPGTRVTETQVAERLGISRTPVRSALQRLHQEGYLESGGDGGRSRLTVAPLTKEDARELFYLIGLLEGFAVRSAAELESAPRHRLADDLRTINEELAELATAGQPDRDAFFDLDHRFHQRYVDVGAGPRSRRLHHSIKPQAERYIRLYVSTHTYEIDPSVAEHRVIISAVDAGKPGWAEEAVNENWRNAEERLRQDIEAVGERGKW